MLVGFAEGLGAAKTYATRAHYEVDPNRELIGLGAANVGSGLMTGMVVNGSLSKTAVNGSAGARSQVSGLAVAVFTVVTLLFLTALFEDLPEATLAAVVIAAVVELVDIGALRGFYGLYTRQLGRIYGRAARPDFIAAVAAMLGVLVFDTLPGLVIGIIVSLLLLLYRASRPHVAELGRVPGAPASSATSTVTRRTRPSRMLPSCASSRGCSSPTPTRCGGRSATGPIGPVRSPSCWTPRRWRSWTSPRCGCSRSWPPSSPGVVSSS